MKRLGYFIHLYSVWGSWCFFHCYTLVCIQIEFSCILCCNCCAILVLHDNNTVFVLCFSFTFRFSLTTNVFGHAAIHNKRSQQTPKKQGLPSGITVSFNFILFIHMHMCQSILITREISNNVSRHTNIIQFLHKLSTSGSPNIQ